MKRYLLKHKKKVFYLSTITLLLTWSNLYSEVIMDGQGLFAVPEELFGWILGSSLGVGGLFFLDNNNYFKKPNK
jgi:hypothetical protein